MSTTKKPPASVTEINGQKPAPIIVSDSDYEEAIDAQRATLLAQGAERKVLGRIRSLLANGAKDGGVKYFFDEELGIVRRRERSGVGS